MMKISRRILPVVGFSLTSIAGLAGCSTEEPYTRPFFNFSSSYQSAPGGAPVLMTNDAWWEKLSDKTLNALIARSLHGNIDLRIARERVVEAYTGLQSVPSQGQIDSIGVYSAAGRGWQRLVERNPLRGGAWRELAVRSLRLAPPADTGGQAHGLKWPSAEVDAARLMLVLNMTNAYVDLRFNQRLLILRRQQLASRRQTFDLTQTLFDKGATYQGGDHPDRGAGDRNPDPDSATAGPNTKPQE